MVAPGAVGAAADCQPEAQHMGIRLKARLFPSRTPAISPERTRAVSLVTAESLLLAMCQRAAKHIGRC